VCKEFDIIIYFAPIFWYIYIKES